MLLADDAADWRERPRLASAGAHRGVQRRLRNGRSSPAQLRGRLHLGTGNVWDDIRTWIPGSRPEAISESVSGCQWAAPPTTGGPGRAHQGRGGGGLDDSFRTAERKIKNTSGFTKLVTGCTPLGYRKSPPWPTRGADGINGSKDAAVRDVRCRGSSEAGRLLRKAGVPERVQTRLTKAPRVNAEM